LTQKKHITQEVFSYQTLINVLTKKFNEIVTDATYQVQKLHGGTVGNVFLIKGLASLDQKEKPYQIVLKKQDKWKRYGDEHSWRREYDLYHSGLHKTFLDDFSWPQCYEAKLNQDSFELWLAYIDGASANDLNLDMYVKAAESLGRFQGKLYEEQPNIIHELNNLSPKDYVNRFYHHYQAWDEVYDYIRSDICDLPKHLCQMLIDLDAREHQAFEQLNQLPIVLCHRDYWNTNIFYVNQGIVAIDWDTTGFGYFGEDMASLIADETNPKHMGDYFKYCVPAYVKGFSQYVDIKTDVFKQVHDLILMMFGYRLVETYKFAEKEADKILAKDSLQAFYDMKQSI